MSVYREKLANAASIKEEGRIEAKITQLEKDIARHEAYQKELADACRRILSLEKRVRSLQDQAADRESLIGAFIEAAGGKA